MACGTACAQREGRLNCGRRQRGACATFPAVRQSLRARPCAIVRVIALITSANELVIELICGCNRSRIAMVTEVQAAAGILLAAPVILVLLLLAKPPVVPPALMVRCRRLALTACRVSGASCALSPAPDTPPLPCTHTHTTYRRCPARLTCTCSCSAPQCARARCPSPWRATLKLRWVHWCTPGTRTLQQRARGEGGSAPRFRPRGDPRGGPVPPLPPCSCASSSPRRPMRRATRRTCG